MGGDERSISTGLAVVGLGVLLVVAVVGAFAVGVVGAPEVVDVENRFGEVTRNTTVVETDLVMHNPNPVGVQLGGTTVNYTVAMNDVPIASGQKDGLAVQRGNTTLEFTTLMRNKQIPKWWVTHIRNSEHTTLHIDARVRSSLLGRTFAVPQSRPVKTDIIGQFNSTEPRPVNADRPLVEDPVLYINRTGAAWGEVMSEETPIDMELVVYNPRATPYTITEVGYNITMNQVSVGGGASRESYVIQGGTTETIRTQTVIRNKRLDEWWVSHLERNQVTRLRIDFWARIELPTGTAVRVPLDELTYETEIETDIFGTKNATGGDATPTSTATGEAADSAGADRSDGTETTPTASPTSTPTPTLSPTPTETDDDFL